MLPSSLELKSVIKRLKEFNPAFNLFSHKKTIKKHRWALREEGSKVEAYPVGAPEGMKSHIDRDHLRAIARHFNVPCDVFTLSIREVRNKYKYTGSTESGT